MLQSGHVRQMKGPGKVRLLPSDRDYLEKLRGETRGLLREVLGSGGRDVVFLDAPTYRNFGDSLIWEGSLRYLRELGFKVRYTADIRRFRDEDLRKVPGDAIIVLEGGGNLGDLWPTCEEFRQHIVKTYPQRRIVIMPQSIHFEDSEALERSAAGYRRGENLTVLLRESRSIEIAREHFRDVDVRFCYDAALGVRVPELPVARQKAGPVIIARGDKESRPDDAAFLAQHAGEDWRASRSNQMVWDRMVWFKNYYAHLPHQVQDQTRAPHLPYDVMRGLNVAAAIRQLDGAPVVVTNRLHGHVLAALLGISHVVTDNSYGKISGIFHEYTNGFSTAHWAESLSGALEVADVVRRSLPHHV